MSDTLTVRKTEVTFRVDESPNAGVLHIADRLIVTAVQRIRLNNGDPVEQVHLLRTTTKRLRALLRLIRPLIARTTFTRQTALLKRASARLAILRDRTVVVATLKSIAGSTVLFNQLHAAVSSSTGAVPSKTTHQRAVRRTARDLERSRAGFLRLRIAGNGLAVLRPGLVQTFRQARRRMKAAAAHPNDRAFHQWRIRVKQLYYQLRWLIPLQGRRISRLCKRLRRLEEKIGRDHDFVVLQAELDKTVAKFQAPDAIRRIEAALARRSKRLRRTCISLGTKLFGETPRQFDRRCRRWLGKV